MDTPPEPPNENLPNHTGNGNAVDECLYDPVGSLKRVFVDERQRGRIGAEVPLLRGAFRKQHGGASGLFVVAPELPNELRIGVFSYAQLPVWVRFSSDTELTGPDGASPLGMGIKLFGVQGPRLLNDGLHPQTHDFVLQNRDVFFVDNASDMCRIFSPNSTFFKKHPTSFQSLLEANKPEPSVLTASYWSIVPYSLGLGRFVKYVVRPEDPTRPPMPNPAPINYLGDDLRDRLRRQDVTFHFMLQLQTDPERMPLDQATVRWDESESPPILAARIHLQAGAYVDEPGTSAYVENLSFHPWRVLPEHRPAGSLSEARLVVYTASAELRRHVNGIPIVEPNPPRPVTPP